MTINSPVQGLNQGKHTTLLLKIRRCVMMATLTTYSDGGIVSHTKPRDAIITSIFSKHPIGVFRPEEEAQGNCQRLVQFRETKEEGYKNYLISLSTQQLLYKSCQCPLCLPIVSQLATPPLLPATQTLERGK